MNPFRISEALPDFKRADSLLDIYLSQKSRPLGKFKPENYFNNTEYKFLNVKTEDLRKVVKLLKKEDKKTLRKFCDLLWNSNVFEKMSIAVETYAYCDLKFSDFERITERIDNWAHCDSFCTRVSGPYLHKNPAQIPKLLKFAKSRNSWKRRFAAVSLIKVLKDPDNAHDAALLVLDVIIMNESERHVLASLDWMIREFVKKNYLKGFKYMKKWASHFKKTENSKIRWILVRARHKLEKKERITIESMIKAVK